MSSAPSASTSSSTPARRSSAARRSRRPRPMADPRRFIDPPGVSRYDPRPVKTCSQCQIKYPDALLICPRDGAALPGHTEAMYDSYLGSTIDGRYLIEAKLGEGGMGVVYAGRHVIIDKRVAIKVLKKEAQEEPTAGQRFVQEAKSASKIGHANIVDITDFGVLPDESAYFVMEFLEGQTLGKAIARGPLPGRRVIAIAAQMARGLNAAHAKGIVHRDLKPENIFLLERDGESDVVKVVDFGIAKVNQPGGPGGEAGQRLTQVGMVLGTPEYMSPEQATGKETDHRVDEYALGCIMYEMLTGDVPFRGDSSAGTLTKHVFEAVVPPSRKRPDVQISPTLEAVTLKAMAKRPEDRYPGMRELLDALDAAGAEIDSGREAVRASEAIADRGRPRMMAQDISAVTDGNSLLGRRSRASILAAVAVVGGVAGWLLLGGAGENSAPQPSTPPVPAVAKKQDPPLPGVPSDVKLVLRSNPPGAEIFLGPEDLGSAPVTYTHAPDATPLHFTFRLAGRKDVTREVVPDENRDVEVSLLEIKREARTKHVSRGDIKPGGAVPPPDPEANSANPPPSHELRNPF
ncbi:MAG: serine/threonine protein kinase [Myxococcales bacterium]|nr:serine/threonine protein kinase [Myxococcales bacterium]